MFSLATDVPDVSARLDLSQSLIKYWLQACYFFCSVTTVVFGNTKAKNNFPFRE